MDQDHASINPPENVMVFCVWEKKITVLDLKEPMLHESLFDEWLLRPLVEQNKVCWLQLRLPPDLLKAVT